MKDKMRNKILNKIEIMMIELKAIRLLYYRLFRDKFTLNIISNIIKSLNIIKRNVTKNRDYTKTCIIIKKKTKLPPIF